MTGLVCFSMISVAANGYYNRGKKISEINVIKFKPTV